MWWFKMPTDYYDAAALVRAGEAAEVLYTRAQAWAAQEETGGLVPREQMPRLAPTRTQARIKALVREALLEPHPDGWRVLGGLPQETTETVAEKRQQSRERTRKWRERQQAQKEARDAAGDTSGDGLGDASRDGSPLLTRELDAACGSSNTREPLPPSVEILRGRLEASGLVVRWDALKPDQLQRIEALIEKHGDTALVHAAAGQHRPNDPAKFASAWLSTWEHGMPDPGRRLGVVRARCEIHGITRSPSGVCSSCVADQKAGDR